MLHVMEHLPNPKETLAEVHRILAPDGMLMVEIPIIDAAATKAMGPRHRHYVFDHTLFMTRSTCAALPRGAGLISLPACDRPDPSSRTARERARTAASRPGHVAARALDTLRLDQVRLTINLRDILPRVHGQTVDTNMDTGRLTNMLTDPRDSPCGRWSNVRRTPRSSGVWSGMHSTGPTHAYCTYQAAPGQGPRARRDQRRRARCRRRQRARAVGGAGRDRQRGRRHPDRDVRLRHRHRHAARATTATCRTCGAPGCSR